MSGSNRVLIRVDLLGESFHGRTANKSVVVSRRIVMILFSNGGSSEFGALQSAG